MTLAIAPNAELEWLYHDSDAELGYASALGPQVATLERGHGNHKMATDDLAAALCPGWVSPCTMSMRQRMAARRVVMYRRALTLMRPVHLAAIELAYEQRNLRGEAGGHELVERFGIAANLVRVTRAMHQARTRAAALEVIRVQTTPGLEGELQRAKQARTRAHAAARGADDRAVATLREAHAAYVAARADQTRDDLVQLRAARQRGETKRMAYLAELTGRRLPREERVRRGAMMLLAELETAD